ncbi:MAG: M48 family metallopeptidase [Candidatus Schekmanbacteria bacterium]|nr:M48 family metallopeptidase [Candidatus Schekmanbacteria bacterium]
MSSNQNYQIIRSNRKTIGLEISPEKGLVVRVPLKTSLTTIQQVLKNKRQWIEGKLAMVALKQRAVISREYGENDEFLYLGKKYPLKIVSSTKFPLVFENEQFLLSANYRQKAQSVFQAWYMIQAEDYLNQRVGYYADRYGFKYNRLRISQALKRWGSCSAQKNLNFNWRLMLAPPEVIDYLVVHELAHLAEMNHSPRYWQRVARIMPDYKRQRKWLKDNGHLLNV